MSNVRRDENLFTATLAVAGLDTLASLLAGLAIFPALFAMKFEPDLGPGLVFQVLPTVFSQMPLGAFWATLFFVLLLVAALTSGISLLEVVTAYFIDERGWERRRAAVVFGSAIFLLGCGSALSVSGWQRLPQIERLLLGLFGQATGSFFDLMDQFSSNWLLPLGGLFISLFVGWIWGTRQALKELRHGAHNITDVNLGNLLAGLKDDTPPDPARQGLTLGVVWGIFIRFVSPAAITIAFLHAVGWLTDA